MEAGDGCEDVSWAAVKEISDKLEVGNGRVGIENVRSWFGNFIF